MQRNQRARNSRSDASRVSPEFAFKDLKQDPARGKCLSNFLSPLAVSFDLGEPECRSSLGLPEVDGTAMPEAAIDKDSYPCSFVRQVGVSRKIPDIAPEPSP